MVFDRIIGHRRPLRLIRAMLAAGRLPQALLVSGPTGVGKRTLALALAQAVNCQGPNPSEPCGVCRACDKIQRGLHPDVLELAPEGRARIIKVEAVRDLRQRITFKSYEGRVKVFIIREADRMREESANALLKTLEEPPPDSLLILTTPEESDLLPTIVSRCLRLNLPPLPREEIEGWLASHRGLDGAQARLLAAVSGGCLGRIKEVAPESLWNFRQEIVDRLLALEGDKPESAVNWAGELAATEERWPDFFTLSRQFFRDLMILAGGARPEGLVNIDLAAELARQAAGHRADSFIDALEGLDRAEDALNRFIKPELVFEDLLMTLAGLGKG